MIPVNEIYGLPYRALYSKNIENLMFAGRNISVTHVALSSTRVMATCALLGQAMGHGAAIALRYGCSPRGVHEAHMDELQNNILEDGVYLPHIARKMSDLTVRAKLNISDRDREILFNGIERPRKEYGENEIKQKLGDCLIFRFDKVERIGTLRLRFDPDYSRESITPNFKMQVFAMKLHTGKDFVPVKVAATLAKEFCVYADGKEIYRVKDNYLELVRIPINTEAKEIKVEWVSTNGADEVGLFGADFI
jgi:hypothetical protein